MDLGSLSGIVDGLSKIDPLGNLIDLGASALGLPPEVTNVVKIAVGAATNDPMLLVSGAVGMAGSLGDGAAGSGPDTELPPLAGGSDPMPGYAPELPDPVPLTPAGVGTWSPPGGTGGGAPDVNTGVPYPLDPDLAGYRDCLQILQSNFDTFDAAVGARDNCFSRDGLQAISVDPNASPLLKRATGFLLDHPEYYNRLDMAAGLGGPDRVIGRMDVNAELGRVEAQMGACAAPPPSGCFGGGHPSSSAGGLRNIVCNPDMNIEDKIEAVLQHVTQSTDSELEDVMGQMSALQDQRAGTKDPAKARKLDQSYEQLQLRLQRCIERRQQMFQLMSNVSEKFNEMAKVAIQNMARA